MQLRTADLLAYALEAATARALVEALPPGARRDAEARTLRYALEEAALLATRMAAATR
jgi:hypothetical protein